MVKIKAKIRYRGVSTIEAAIVFPVLLLITFGAIEYGWLFLKAQQVTNVARTGAREAVRAGAVPQDVVNEIQFAMQKAGISNYDAPIITPGSFSNLAAGDPITVQVSVDLADVNSPLVNFPGIMLPAKLKASVTMAREGPS